MPRERRLLGAAAIVTVVAGGFQWFVYPAWDSRQRSMEQLAEFDSVVALLEALPDTALSTVPADLPQVRSRVTDSASRAGLEIRRLDPQGDTAVAVSMGDASFAALVGWLGQLTGSEHVAILSAEIGRKPEPGIVSARFLLEAR